MVIGSGGFFRKENIILLEARSILHAVRCAESRCPRGRLLVVSDNLVLVMALCEGQAFLHCFQLCVVFLSHEDL